MSWGAGGRYWARRFWAARYWFKSSGAPATPPVTILNEGDLMVVREHSGVLRIP